MLHRHSRLQQVGMDVSLAIASDISTGRCDTPVFRGMDFEDRVALTRRRKIMTFRGSSAWIKAPSSYDEVGALTLLPTERVHASSCLCVPLRLEIHILLTLVTSVDPSRGFGSLGFAP